MTMRDDESKVCKSTFRRFFTTTFIAFLRTSKSSLAEHSLAFNLI